MSSARFTSVVQELRTIEALLRKHRHDGQAEVVSDLIRLDESGSPKFEPELLSIEMWGGAGAVWEVGTLGEDILSFRNAIIRLVEAIEETGLATERMRFISMTFQTWNSSGL